MFALGVTLYLSFGLGIYKDSFTQSDIAALRKKLVDISHCTAKDTANCSVQYLSIFEHLNLQVQDGVVLPKKSPWELQQEEDVLLGNMFGLEVSGDESNVSDGEKSGGNNGSRNEKTTNNQGLREDQQDKDETKVVKEETEPTKVVKAEMEPTKVVKVRFMKEEMEQSKVFKEETEQTEDDDGEGSMGSLFEDSTDKEEMEQTKDDDGEGSTGSLFEDSTDEDTTDEEKEETDILTRKRKIVKRGTKMVIPSYSKKYVSDDLKRFTDTCLFPDYKTITFDSLEDAKQGIAAYCRESGFFLKFFKSEVQRGRLVAQCTSHDQCTYGVQIDRDPKSHQLCVKKIDHQHKKMSIVKEDGKRNFRKRLDYDVLPYASAVESLKAEPVKAKDIMKAGAKDGDILNYDVSQRSLVKWKGQQKTAERMSYQQIAGYLRSFEESNEGSHVDIEVDDENQLTNVFCCPSFMDDILRLVKPVIQLDVCHKLGAWGGTLFLITVYSACQDVYPIAMGLTAENESEATWRYVLEHLRQACPVLSEFQGPCRDELATENDPEPLEDGFSEASDSEVQAERLQQQRQFQFGAVSDRDKGMQKAFHHVFPSIF